jgi:hypothetical protein
MRRILAFVLLLSLVACDEPIVAPEASITGIWTVSSGGRTLEMNLTHAGSSGTGTGTLLDAAVSPTRTHVLTIAGTYDGGTSQWGWMELQLTSPTTSAMSITAFYSSSAFDGSIQGGPFAQTTSILLSRRD